MTRGRIEMIIVAKKTIATKNTIERDGEIDKHMIIDIVSISGGRIAIRMIIINAFCTFVTSVVSLVTSPAVENLSILENEYV